MWVCFLGERPTLAMITSGTLPPPLRRTCFLQVSAKYFSPDFGAEFEMIPATAQLVVQYDVDDKTQTSDCWGARRALLPTVLRAMYYQHSALADTERALWKVSTKDVCASVHRMSPMRLNNFSARRSDARTMTEL